MTITEEEIRPQHIFDEYLRLAKEDIQEYFVGAVCEEVLCPACGAKGEHAFRKSHFDYETCPDCKTLYVSPRPAAELFSKYYTQGKASEYWATTFYKETAEARREKLWKPKAQLIHSILERFSANDFSIVDIGGGYGIFAEEIAKLLKNEVTVIEPGTHLAEACRSKSLNVVEKFLENVVVGDLPNGAKAFVSFELFEHLYDPATFLENLFEVMGSSDLFIFTTLSGTGIDIQALWEDSKSVSPPHHLNFLNPHSAELLLQRLGFKVVEITTPGKLDIDILYNNASLIKDRFWSNFVAMASDDMKAQWQELLASSGWSSHMMIVCQKP
ncbi:MAG: class I SAM-dependent methyltransferase [Rhodospirillales bacterium]|nr:class I SAM-dependent methyltransferase [Rhodospirillales bacterium]